MGQTPPELAVYATRWSGWVKDPLIRQAGITFDRTPAGRITAPPGKVRLCAYHIDFDERPTCYQDVDTPEIARQVVEHFQALSGDWNVDYIVAYDETGGIVATDWPA